MFKNISLAAIAALGASVMAASPASAFNNATDACIPSAFQDCPDVDVIPTPPALLAVIGMGMASLRKKNQNQDAE